MWPVKRGCPGWHVPGTVPVGLGTGLDWEHGGLGSRLLLSSGLDKICAFLQEDG